MNIGKNTYDSQRIIKKLSGNLYCMGPQKKYILEVSKNKTVDIILIY